MLCDCGKYVSKIKQSGLTIYDINESLYIPTSALEYLLNKKLQNESLAGLSNRTRSKKVKEMICEALGYPVPKSFKKTQPRFPCQNFDVYNQKGSNLQIWNEPIDTSRRYVIIRISSDDQIQKVKIVSGNVIAALDTTGTLTQKYQASLIGKHVIQELVSCQDTDNLSPYLASKKPSFINISPNDVPISGLILPIQVIYQKLVLLLGTQIKDEGTTQDRRRGDELHRHVCQSLGYKFYEDDGQFPDIRHQLLEVKLQTAQTIDLGHYLPTNHNRLSFASDSLPIRYCDVRYAVFYGTRSNHKVTLTNFYLASGRDFFSRFRQFRGKVTNRKHQIALPSDFFD